MEANFLIDSESRLKAALAQMNGDAMIERLIRYCATNRFIVLIIVAVLVFIGIWSIKHIAVDALPDLSDTQVIVYSKWDRSPDIIEDQVTYPDHHRRSSARRR